MTTVALGELVVWRALLWAAVLPVRVVFMDLPGGGEQSPRTLQRRGLSRVYGRVRCPELRALLRRRCTPVPSFVRMSRGGDALLGEGTSSYGPAEVVDAYRRWRWEVAQVYLPEVGEELTLVRWIGHSAGEG